MVHFCKVPFFCPWCSHFTDETLAKKDRNLLGTSGIHSKIVAQKGLFQCIRECPEGGKGAGYKLSWGKYLTFPSSAGQPSQIVLQHHSSLLNQQRAETSLERQMTFWVTLRVL